MIRGLGLRRTQPALCQVKKVIFYLKSASGRPRMLSIPPFSADAVVEITILGLVPCFLFGYIDVRPSRQVAANNQEARHGRASRMAWS